ncbi:MAG: NAD(P)/FAD-dependent oxidoreductase [Pseudomonadota bacterium]
MTFTRFLAFAALSLAATASAQDTTHDVIIVGAGSAGLYAARTLIADGYDVLIIEATDRIGGRVYSATLGGTRVDLGAEEHYLADGNNPVWPAIREEFGNDIYVSAYLGGTAYSMDGGTTTCWDLGSATRNCADDADTVVYDGFGGWAATINQHQDPTTSLAEDVFAEYGVQEGDRSYHLYDAGYAGGIWATSLQNLGARSLALQDNQWTLSNGVRVLNDPSLGYSDALEMVWWNDVVANSDLLLSRPVTRIDTSGDDVTVTDTSGDRHAARQVIVTVSIGVLQSEMINFVPDLPTSTVDAYSNIGIDKGMKVPIRFTNPWWETEGQPLAWLVTEGVAGACWVPSDYKVGSSDNILLCYPMGNNAQALDDIAIAAGGGSAGDSAIIDAVLADLDSVFPVAAGAASANFIDGIVQNWGAHPYTLGAYSYPSVSTYTSGNDSRRLDLRAPVANNRIYFAGEATNHQNPSTVVGALQEGERAATEVAAINGNPNNPPPLPGTGGGGGNPGAGGGGGGNSGGGGGGATSIVWLALLSLVLNYRRRQHSSLTTACETKK